MNKFKITEVMGTSFIIDTPIKIKDKLMYLNTRWVGQNYWNYWRKNYDTHRKIIQGKER